MKKKTFIKNSIYILSAVFISYLFILSKDSLGGVDRLNYLQYANASDIILKRNFSQGIIKTLVNEPVFLIINIILSILFLPENIIVFIIFTSTLTVLMVWGKMSKYDFYGIIIFLLIPQLTKNHTVHIRQGLAVAIYLFGIAKAGKYSILKYISCFIHTSIIFLIFFEYAERFMLKLRLEYKLKLILFSIISLITIEIIPKVAMFFGDRRAQEYAFEVSNGSSGLGFLFWIFLLLILISLSEKKFWDNVVLYGLIFYLLSYFRMEISARIFESVLPLLIIQTITVKNKKKQNIFKILFVLYAILNIIF